MIPILIGKNKHSIKSINELTANEFIEFHKLKAYDPLSYIAWQTGMSIEHAYMATYSRAIERSIGRAEDVSSLPKSDRFDYSQNIATVGQRHQVERCGKKGYDLLVYCLAVAQCNTLDETVIQKKYAFYLKQNWQEIMPAGFFFMKILANGAKQGLMHSAKRQVLRGIYRIKKQLVLIGFLHIAMSMRLKRLLHF